MVQKIKHRNGIIMFFVIMATFSCKYDEKFEYYDRPDYLVGPIYEQLDSQGIFTSYLECLDQTEFKEPLSKGGSWTVFVPTDEAFAEFMTAEGYASVSQIPSKRVYNLVQNSIIIDAYNTTTLTYYPRQFYLGTSFKRFTQFQDTIRSYELNDFSLKGNDTITLQGVETRSIRYPDLNTWSKDDTYLVDDSNGDIKTTSYFLQPYFEQQANHADMSDYSFMFPGESFSPGDMKVYEANVSQANLVAENGMIYVLDKVLEPRKNMYQNLSSEEYDDKYSLFKSLIQRFGYLDYSRTELNEETGVEEEIYNLGFRTDVSLNLLSFDINQVTYPRLTANINRDLAMSTGVAVPTNQALEDYLDSNSVIGEVYNSYDDMPLDVLGKFLSPFYFANYWSLCPSHFGQSYNVAIKLVDYSEADVVDKKYCSNGFFVGVNRIYENASFVTVMGPILLDPDYSIMLKGILGLGIETALESSGLSFSVLGIKNDQFVNVADPNSATRTITITGQSLDLETQYMTVTGDPDPINNREYPDRFNPSSVDIAYVQKTIEDIVVNQIVEQSIDFNSNNYYQTKAGDFVYASGGNKVTGGNNVAVDVVESRDAVNGKFYEMGSFVGRPLRYPFGALLDTNNFSSFLAVLEGAGALIDIPGSDDKLINFFNASKSYTLLAPSDAAVAQAIIDEVIVDPSTLASLDELTMLQAELDLLNFVKRHFINTGIPTDGTVARKVTSLYFSKVVNLVTIYDSFLLENSYSPSMLTLTNTETGDVITTNSLTNLLSKKVVIHGIDNYIK